jgi:hypothetical protein
VAEFNRDRRGDGADKFNICRSHTEEYFKVSYKERSKKINLTSKMEPARDGYN